jgi:hypothetical protein
MPRLERIAARTTQDIMSRLNLWLGLHNVDGEWPWTCFFPLTLQVIFALHRYGKSLGLDAIMRSVVHAG